MKIAFLFPGQGSQFPGMGKDLYENHQIAKDIYNKADEILGYSLSDISFNGTEDDLKQTKVTQPAIFTHSVVCYEILKGLGIDAEAVAGHSLGECSALYAAGVFDFETGLSLVKNRAESMDVASQREKGTMAAIIGLGFDKVKEICDKIGVSKVINPANFNSPEQLVISGSEDAVIEACEMAKAEGAKLAKILTVSGAFHSALMKSAEESMGEVLYNAEFDSPQKIFIANVTGSVVEDTALIKKYLKEQITSCVLWVDSIRAFLNKGFDTFVEVGPGKVLTGLMRKIDKSVVSYTTSNLDTINVLKEKLTSQ